MDRIAKLRLCVLAACTLMTTQPLLAQQTAASAVQVDSQALVYGYDEMFNFDTEKWLSRNAPHLLPHAESISHWAGYSSISPKVLIALMEQESKVVSRRGARADAATKPFGKLSKQSGFNAQTRDIALTLREALYELDDARNDQARGAVALNSVNPLQILQSISGESDASAARKGGPDFQAVYAGLFNEPRRGGASRSTKNQDAVIAFASSFLQFPFPVGQTWSMGGAHTNTGQGSYPLSSLDMYKGGGWGSNQSSNWVVASASGSFKRHSSCFAEVVHSNNTSTTYYHMSNLQLATGASIAKNGRIGNPANTQAQALCNGGQSTGPHVHWSLKTNGSLAHLNGVTLHDYVITATGTSYDTNCTRFYLTRNGVKRCAGTFYAH